MVYGDSVRPAFATVSVHVRTPAKFALVRISALHLVTLFTLAVAHPLYDVLGQGTHAPFFIAHQSTALDIWLFVLFLSFILPAVLCLGLWLLNLLSSRLARGLHAIEFCEPCLLQLAQYQSTAATDIADCRISGWQ